MSQLLSERPNGIGMPSPEQMDRKPGDSLVVDVEGTRGVFLHGNGHIVSPAAIDSLAIAVDHSVGVEQSLLAVLSLDDKEKVGVVKVARGEESAIMLTRLTDNKDGSGAAGFLAVVEPNETLVMGREKLMTANEYISRTHFSVELQPDGDIRIADASTNGTELVTAVHNNSPIEEVVPSGLRKVFAKLKGSGPAQGTDKGIGNTVSIANYIETPASWALNSAMAVSNLDTSRAQWHYTSMPESMDGLLLVRRLYEEACVDERGIEVPAKYAGREVIKRDSKINGGVYIVPGIQEAVVVDDGRKQEGGNVDRRLSDLYSNAYVNFLQVAKANGVSIEHGVKPADVMKVAGAAFESAMRLIKYDAKYSSNLAKSYTDQKVNLSYMLGDKKGVCRHQALLVAYYLERAINGGHMKGRVSVDRNYIPNLGGHAWARLTGGDGQVYVIDPAQNFFGTLEESKIRSTWDYRRDEERT